MRLPRQSLRASIRTITLLSALAALLLAMLAPLTATRADAAPSNFVFAGFIELSDGTVIGEITSGGFSPNLKKNISMGYVLKEHAKKGTELKVVVRKKVNDAVVTPMPFVPAKYHRPA